MTGNSQRMIDRGHQQIVARCRRGSRSRLRSSKAFWMRCCSGTPMLSARRAEAAQQREDGQRDDAEHGDLAEGVEAAEVDEDDVDDVGAAAFGIGVLEEVAARSSRAAAVSSPRRRARRGRRRQRPRAPRSRSAARARVDARWPCRRATWKRFGSQRRPSSISTVVTISTRSCVRARSGAENQTKVMQVTRPAPPRRISAASRWIFGLPGRAERAGAADQPRPSRRRGSNRRGRQVARPEAPDPDRSAAGQAGDADDQPELRLQPSRAERSLPAGAPRRQETEQHCARRCAAPRDAGGAAARPTPLRSRRSRSR